MMKLSKKDLRRALQGEEQDLANEGFFPNRFGNLVQALNEGVLEIEGYERSGWTRLDPNDESTHPKEGTPVLFTCYNPIDKWGMLADIASNDVIDDWKNISRLFAVVFWREVTFPKPPTETEGKQ
jgi:hypothetical protein